VYLEDFVCIVSQDCGLIGGSTGHVCGKQGVAVEDCVSVSRHERPKRAQEHKLYRQCSAAQSMFPLNSKRLEKNGRQDKAHASPSPDPQAYMRPSWTKILAMPLDSRATERETRPRQRSTALHFYRATLCVSAVFAVGRCPSVNLSLRNVM